MARPGSLVDFVLRIEGPPKNDDWPTLKAWRGLRNGNLVEAQQQVASGSQATRDLMTLLVGASEGASPNEVKAALEVKPTPDVAWVAAALSLREGEGLDTIGDAVPSLRDEAEQRDLAAALADPALVKHTQQLEVIAKRLPLRDRAALLGMGLVVLGDKAPATWRAEVKALLFVTERPYFR